MRERERKGKGSGRKGKAWNMRGRKGKRGRYL